MEMRTNNEGHAKSVAEWIFEGAPEIAGISDKDNFLIENYMESAKKLSSIATESVYIIDFPGR